MASAARSSRLFVAGAPVERFRAECDARRCQASSSGAGSFRPSQTARSSGMSLPNPAPEATAALTLADLEAAVRASWSRDTSADADEWTPENPARGDSAMRPRWSCRGLPRRRDPGRRRAPPRPPGRASRLEPFAVRPDARSHARPVSAPARSSAPRLRRGAAAPRELARATRTPRRACRRGTGRGHVLTARRAATR